MRPAATNGSLPIAGRIAPGAVRLWLSTVVAAWSMAHGLNAAFAIAARCSEAQRFVWWTSAKAVTWLVPTMLLARRAATEAPGRWLGLHTWHGMGRALVVTISWLTLQALRARLELPQLEPPPSEPRWADLPGALLVAPLFEELMFRGVMLRTMRDQGSGRERIVLSTSLVFALLHLPGWLARRGLDPTIAGSFCGIALFGVVLGYLGWHARSLWAPVLLHVLHNAWSTGLLGWLARAPQMPGASS